ncbi:MAG: hypothetical protein NVS3B26_07120 [Mycobacteriales bacterium]
MPRSERAARWFSGVAVLTVAIVLFAAGVALSFLPLELLGVVLLVVAVGLGRRSRRGSRWVFVLTYCGLAVVTAVGLWVVLASTYGDLGR